MDFKIQLFSAIILSMTAISTTSASSKFETAENIMSLFDHKKFALIVTLLEEGKINPLTPIIKYGGTLLYLISATDNYEAGFNIVRAILAKGTDPNIANQFHETPLHESSCFDRKIKITKLLLRAGANQNLQNWDKRTALYNAFYFKSPKSAALLLRKGGVLDIGPSYEKTLRQRMVHALQKTGFQEEFFKKLIPFKKLNKTPKNQLLFIKLLTNLLLPAQPKSNKTLTKNQLSFIQLCTNFLLHAQTESSTSPIDSLCIKFIQFYFDPRKKIIFSNSAPTSNEYPALTTEEEQIRKELFTKTFYELAVERYHHGLSKREFAVFTNLGKLRQAKHPKRSDFVIKFSK